MDKGHTNQLLYRFKNLSADEVLQEIAIAEFKANGRGAKLAFRIAYRNLQDLDRRRQRFEDRFTTDLELGKLPVDAGFIENRLFDRYMEDDAWRYVLSRLQPGPRKLAEFANEEALLFEDVPGGVWTKLNLIELRRRVKRRFIEWDFKHRESAYMQARSMLLNALRRHESWKMPEKVYTRVGRVGVQC